jgi:acyl-CoA thioesterase FadM
MARIKIELPESFPFTTDLDVRISDINYGGHLGNDAVLSLIHEARIRFLASLGFSEMDIDGRGLIMVDAAVVYKGEGFHGDRLVVEVGVTSTTRNGCDFVYRILNRDTGRELVLAKTGIVFFDYERRKVVRIPPLFLDAVNQKNPSRAGK